MEKKKIELRDYQKECIEKMANRNKWLKMSIM